MFSSCSIPRFVLRRACRARFVYGCEMTIDSDIADLRNQLAQLERKAELLRAELRGLERAQRYIVRITPSQSVAAFLNAHKPQRTEPVRGGRQPGAISNRWKIILASLMDGAFDEGAVAQAIEAIEGRKIKRSEVKRQFEAYIEHGYLERAERGMYRVTPSARQKLRLDEIKPLPEGNNEIGPTHPESGETDAQGRDSALVKPSEEVEHDNMK